jgi:outer membrane receptor protein involved in Fe transport
MAVLGISMIAILILHNASGYAQNPGHHHHFRGKVMGIEQHESHQDTVALIGANVYWLGTSIGTTTDSEGRFHLDKPNIDELKLIISYVAFANDTLHIHAHDEYAAIYLTDIRWSEKVVATAKYPNILNASEDVRNTQKITKSGLRTLACCDLSESFENTSAVDVERADAISGAKRIKMLGLAGFYTQILEEKKPVIRGLVSPFALDYIPGYWMESIDISKGTASVMTGYESTTGQINVELRKPETDDPAFLNVYQNSLGKTEMSLGASHQLNENLSSMLLMYGNRNRIRHEGNKDTFLDMPLISHFNVMNRWKLQSTNAVDGQLGIKAIYDNRDGGQSGFDFDEPEQKPGLYGFNTKTTRVEVFAKAGKALDKNANRSIGLIVSAFNHDNEAFWGMKTYSGKEKSFYSNLIYQQTTGAHKIAAGASIVFDGIDEILNKVLYERTEKVPGAFVEYSWMPHNNLTGVVGFRYDRHNLYGDFYTPRFHLRYLWSPSTTLRLSAGKGYRSPHIFTENHVILASSKELNIVETPKAEEAWNYGFQFISDFDLGENHPATFMIDLYRTTFVNRVIVDTEQDVGKIYIYNLDGSSYSNSVQTELQMTLYKGLQTTLAWRWNDVKNTINGQLLDQPLNNRHKGLIVFSYNTRDDKWQFDFTTQLNGRTRLPNTSMNPEVYRMDDYSPRYALLFGQITRKFNMLEFYIGMENITNFRQTDPILAWQDPYGPYFDASLIWGPVTGRRVYAGIRVN